MCVYIYKHTHTHTHTHIYIYILSPSEICVHYITSHAQPMSGESRLQNVETISECLLMWGLFRTIYIYIHINISVYIYRFCVDSSSILNSKETLWNTDLPTMISSTPPRKGTRRGVRPSSSVVENISAVPMCGPPKWTSQPVSKLSGSSLACPRGFVRLYQFITKYLYWSECSPFPTGWGTAITNWVGQNSKLAIYIYIYIHIYVYIYIYIYKYALSLFFSRCIIRKALQIQWFLIFQNMFRQTVYVINSDSFERDIAISRVLKWKKISKVSSIVISYSKFCRELMIRESAEGPATGTRGWEEKNRSLL